MVSQNLDKLLVIVGQTASGKTSLAIKMAKKYNGEIICADSRTVYKEADIGTAKPTKDEQKLVRHHLLDIVAIDKPFSVSDFKRLADRAIVDISSRGKLPILVGGSGLYIDAVIYDYTFRSTQDTTARDVYKDASVEELQAELVARGIEFPENSQNKRYLIRSLEAGNQLLHHNILRDNTLLLGLDVGVEKLTEQIEKRTVKMVKDGILDELSQLAYRYGWDYPVMKSAAYKSFRCVIEGKCSETEAMEDCIRLDLKLAKKQRTWFKRNKSIQWVSDPSKSVEILTTFLNN